MWLTFWKTISSDSYWLIFHHFRSVEHLGILKPVLCSMRIRIYHFRSMGIYIIYHRGQRLDRWPWSVSCPAGGEGLWAMIGFVLEACLRWTALAALGGDVELRANGQFLLLIYSTCSFLKFHNHSKYALLEGRGLGYPCRLLVFTASCFHRKIRREQSVNRAGGVNKPLLRGVRWHIYILYSTQVKSTLAEAVHNDRHNNRQRRPKGLRSLSFNPLWARVRIKKELCVNWRRIWLSSHVSIRGSAGLLKGTGSRDRIQLFWRKCIILGLYTTIWRNLFLSLFFSVSMGLRIWIGEARVG